MILPLIFKTGNIKHQHQPHEDVFISMWRTKNRNENSLNDRSKVEASETRFVWISEAFDDVSFDSRFSLCIDRSLLNGCVLTLKIKTNISSIETKVEMNIACKILYDHRSKWYNSRGTKSHSCSGPDHAIFVQFLIIFPSQRYLYLIVDGRCNFRVDCCIFRLKDKLINIDIVHQTRVINVYV